MIVTSFEIERIMKILIKKVINGSFLDILHQAEDIQSHNQNCDGIC